MRHLIGWLAVFCLFAMPAQGAVTRYIGNWQIVSKTEDGKCNDYDPVGEQAVVRFRPVIPGTDNGSNATLSLFYRDSTRNFNVSGNFNSEFKKTVGTEIFDYGNTGTTPKQSVQFEDQSPGTIKANTPTIIITGEVINWDYMQGCRIQFRMVLQKRIEN